MSHPQAILTDLSHEGLIRTRGADAVSFLQGQLSTDIEALGTATSQLSSWNNAKGRVVSLLRLFRRSEDIYLVLPAGLKAAVLKRLSMYVLRSKVTLTDASDEFGRLGLIGEGAPALLAQTDIPAPTSSDDITSTGAIQAIRL